MSIQKVNSPSFNGIRKVVQSVVTETEPQISKIKHNLLGTLADTFSAKEKDLFEQGIKSKLKTITGLISNKKNVGGLLEYENGSFIGVRTYSDGTKAEIFGVKFLTKMFGETLLSGSIVSGKNILTPHIPFFIFNKKGKPIFPPLKTIKDYNRPSNILKLVKEGKLKIVNAGKA